MAFDDESIYDIVSEPVLAEPVLIVCLEGWVDAGLGASSAIASMLATSSTELVATFDGDVLLDQRARYRRTGAQEGRKRRHRQRGLAHRARQVGQEGR